MDADQYNQGLLNHLTIESLAKSHPRLIREFVNREPIKTAASFGGLLIARELQANCYRVEVLVHLAMAYCTGTAQPSHDLIQRSFKILGDGVCGMVEDPSEDVFVSLVSTPRGNYRVFEGIREGTGFHLQRVLNVMETMPMTPPFLEIRNAVDGLLRLSETVAYRAGLTNGTLGQEMPLRSVPKGLLHKIGSCRRLLQFSQSELEELEIANSALSTFESHHRLRTAIRSQSVGHTELERYPVVTYGDVVYLLLPTAVGTAITRLVVDAIHSMGLRDTFETALAYDYGSLFGEASLLGSNVGAPIIFERILGGRTGGIIREVDQGRFLHLVFLVDGPVGFEKDGLSGHNQDPEVWGSVFGEHVLRTAESVSGRAGFRGGLSLLVACGLGRAFVCPFNAHQPRGWRVEWISAYDLVTLSWLYDFDALSLWRLLDARDELYKQGVELMNPNGLLNLVAWSRHLGGHLVPHGQIPDDPTASGPMMIVVQQNMLRELRQQVSADWSHRRVRDVSGRWVKALKLAKSDFEEDNKVPLFASHEDAIDGRLRGIYVGAQRSWGLDISAQDGVSRRVLYGYWEMLCKWLARAAPILQSIYSSLPPGPLSFEVRFKELLGTTHGFANVKTADELRRLLTINAEAGNPEVQITVDSGYDDGFSQPENVAERMMVEAMVIAAATVAGDGTDLTKLYNETRKRDLSQFGRALYSSVRGSLVPGLPLT